MVPGTFVIPPPYHDASFLLEKRVKSVDSSGVCTKLDIPVYEDVLQAFSRLRCFWYLTAARIEFFLHSSFLPVLEIALRDTRDQNCLESR